MASPPQPAALQPAVSPSPQIAGPNPHMGEGGGMGRGCPSPSVQKPIPSRRAENQGPSKKFLAKKRGGSNFYKKSLSFVIFAWKDRTLILLKKVSFDYSCFRKKSQFPPIIIWFVPPFPPSTPPLQRKKVSPPLKPFWGVLQILRYSSPPLEKSRRPCVPEPIPILNVFLN